MSQAEYTAEQILEELDRYAAEAWYVLMLDNGYIYAGDVRLTAYRDPTHWAIVIEMLGYCYKAGLRHGIQLRVHRLGNHRQENRPEDIQPITFPEGLDHYENYLPEGIDRVYIRGQPVAVPRDPAAYEARGIVLRNPPLVAGQDLMRVLLPEHREGLLATEEERRRGLPHGLPRLLTLDEWHHPDLTEIEVPSDAEVFRLLAEVLATGDLNRFNTTEEPNTHWSNWPMGGAC